MKATVIRAETADRLGRFITLNEMQSFIIEAIENGAEWDDVVRTDQVLEVSFQPATVTT